ncbi:MAG: hypothetical protein K1V97_03375 [Lachnospiraceae bacterium]
MESRLETTKTGVWENPSVSACPVSSKAFAHTVFPLFVISTSYITLSGARL